MATPFKKKSGSKVEFTLDIPESALRKEKKKLIDHYRTHVKAKGFRKGHAPDEVVIAHINPQKLSYEALNEAINTEYRGFINEHQLQPVSAPHIEFPHPDKKPIKILCTVEVFPEVSVGSYQKIKSGKVQVKVTDEEIQAVIKNIMADKGVFKIVDRKSQKDDFLQVNFVGKDEKGSEIPQTKGEKVNFILGSGQFLEDLEKAFESMKPKEEKKNIKVKFPKNYPAADLQGKTIRFDIMLHEVRELIPEDLKPKDIEQITGQKKSISELKEDIQTILEQRKQEEEKKKIIDDYSEKLAKIVKTDLPESWITKEVNMRLEEIHNSPQYKNNPEEFWKMVGKTEEKTKKEFKESAEKNLKVFLGLSHIIKQEKIELNKDEEKKAQSILERKQAQNKNSNFDRESEYQRIALNLKIDKYFDTLTL